MTRVSGITEAGNLTFSQVEKKTPNLANFGANTLSLAATAIGSSNGGHGSSLMMTLHSYMQNPGSQVMTTDNDTGVGTSNIFSLSYDRYQNWNQMTLSAMFEANIVAYTNEDTKGGTPIGVKAWKWYGAMRYDNSDGTTNTGTLVYNNLTVLHADTSPDMSNVTLTITYDNGGNPGLYFTSAYSTLSTPVVFSALLWTTIAPLYGMGTRDRDTVIF